MGTCICPMRALRLRGEDPNLVLSGALLLCQTAATDTSVSPDWTLHTTYWQTHTQRGASLIKMFFGHLLIYCAADSNNVKKVNQANMNHASKNVKLFDPLQTDIFKTCLLGSQIFSCTWSHVLLRDFTTIKSDNTMWKGSFEYALEWAWTHSDEAIT